ncbi:unnamed protein product [Caenorhabditis auriculariae]|uniref:Innexin n=1 Tax=Caenorhabditis auriculariae TaxID=2777116 RepID=A0A8S1H569_9PELO|nr:unnamed protein product [Caenorhabditis auriculariae]
MLGAIAPYIGRIRRSYQSNDVVDRLSYQYTALLVAIGALTLAATQYVGKPIQCWVPAQFTGAWEKYAETYCFIKGSYFVPNDEHPDEDFVARDEAVVGYYQWVPLMLAVQAFMFYFPCFLWQAFNPSSGINVKDVLESAAKVKKNVRTSEREKEVSKAASHLIEALELQRELKTDAGFISKMRKSGNFLSTLYLFTKVLYLVNIFWQFHIFAVFLNTSNYFWGWDTFMNITSGIQWDQTGFFPRVTMCDFTVRVLGALHRWTVQCVLMINMFTEKIYVFFWFWFLLVGVITTLSLVYWIFALASKSSRRQFVSKYLRCMNLVSLHPNKEENRYIDSFVNNFVTGDGVFLLRLIQTNGGDLLVSEIVASLFREYMKRHDREVFGDSPDTTATMPR